MRRNKAVAVVFAVLAVSATAQTVTPRQEKIAIVGATLIDVNNYGHSTNDIADSVVLIDEGQIIAVGSATQINIPSGSTRIDAHGEFLVPGLVDGFGALRNQAFANAYLYEGVTTVYVPTILPNGGGDGELKIVRNASPGPRLFLGAPMTGYSEQGADPSDKPMLDHRLHDRRLSNEQLIARVDQLADQGFRGVTISYDVWPDQVDVIVAESKRRGMATLAEPAFTPYPYAIHAGVSGLLRNDHYLLELAPPSVLVDRADNLNAGSAASRAICMVDPASSEVADFGAQLAKSNTALMPTLSMEATADALDVPNPWSAPSAALIKPADLDDPVNPSTGESAFLTSLTAERRKRVRDCAWHKQALDARLYQLGAKYTAGSSATSYGIMPGSGLHLELTLLHRIGLSPREAIAAATSNFANIYGWRDVGRIEPGRVADVLILDADPRSDLAALDHIDRIIFRGSMLNRQSLLEAHDKK
jgi:Amidohydrolase family